jgi:hypothetical protein
MLNHFHTLYQRLAGAGRTGAYQASGRSAEMTGPLLVDVVA